MNSVEINQEQKDKLLKMCKILFPKYIFINFQEYAIMELGWDYDFNNLCFSTKSNKIFDIELNIHWFEFCMTHLINELAWKNIKTDILADCEFETARIKYLNELFKDRPNKGQYHPIDYLYEKFKEINAT